MDMTISEFAQTLESFATVVAVIAAGVWGYFRFLKGRTFHERLEIILTGTIREYGNTPILLVAYEVKKRRAKFG